MKYFLVLALIAVVLASGCVNGTQEAGSQQTTKYVCADGSIADSPDKCPKYEVQKKIEPYCGDGVCQETEDCSSCPGDCGGCPLPCPEISGLVLNQDGDLKITKYEFGQWKIKVSGQDNVYNDGANWVVMCEDGPVKTYRYCRVLLIEKVSPESTLLTGREQTVTVVYNSDGNYVETQC